MEQYISKSALVAEIERRRDLHYKYYMKNGRGSIAECKYDEDKEILSFIDTLKVKEVDYRPIDKDFERDAVNFCMDNALNTTPRIAKTIAKHFFELGLKAQKGNRYV